MRIFDCFMFYDEEVVLDIRLNSLKNSVDCFVIVESKFYHNGKRRDLKFDINKYPKFKDNVHEKEQEVSYRFTQEFLQSHQVSDNLYNETLNVIGSEKGIPNSMISVPC